MPEHARERRACRCDFHLKSGDRSTAAGGQKKSALRRARFEVVTGTRKDLSAEAPRCGAEADQ